MEAHREAHGHAGEDVDGVLRQGREHAAQHGLAEVEDVLLRGADAAGADHPRAPGARREAARGDGPLRGRAREDLSGADEAPLRQPRRRQAAEADDDAHEDVQAPVPAGAQGLEREGHEGPPLAQQADQGAEHDAQGLPVHGLEDVGQVRPAPQAVPGRQGGAAHADPHQAALRPGRRAQRATAQAAGRGRGDARLRGTAVQGGDARRGGEAGHPRRLRRGLRHRHAGRHPAAPPPGPLRLRVLGPDASGPRRPAPRIPRQDPAPPAPATPVAP
mmetsp:Transcript_15019/g.51994  ORF Transcript_15019/g.51994 Transcript_15019/m.51994 type:complete len:274 (+) Transcript_15019:800-1621(+)